MLESPVFWRQRNQSLLLRRTFWFLPSVSLCPDWYLLSCSTASLLGDSGCVPLKLRYGISLCGLVPEVMALLGRWSILTEALSRDCLATLRGWRLSGSASETDRKRFIETLAHIDRIHILTFINRERRCENLLNVLQKYKNTTVYSLTWHGYLYDKSNVLWERVATPLRALFCKDLARYHTEWGILYYVRQPWKII